MPFLRSITFGEVERRLFDRDSLVGRMVGETPEFRGVKQRLGRNAADVKAGAAQFGVFFDDGGLKPVWPARTAAE